MTVNVKSHMSVLCALFAGLGRCIQKQSRSDRSRPNLRGAEEKRCRVPHGRPGRSFTNSHATESTTATSCDIFYNFPAIFFIFCLMKPAHHMQSAPLLCLCFSLKRNIFKHIQPEQEPILLFIFFSFFWWFLKNGFIFLNLWFNQGVPEVDPASHKYKATPQPKPASQTPQTSAPSSLPAQTHLPNMAGPITPNPEQVSLTIKHCVLHCLRRDV